MCVVNPLTALAMLDVLKSKKEKVVVLTAAASALCRMMNRIYPAEGVQIINIVRRQ
jgi:NADPH-dependent curcumin reductase CurA